MTTQTIDRQPQAEPHDSNSPVSLLKKIFNWKLLKETYHEWSRDDAARLAAALAYYVVTALGPLLVGILAIAGFVYSTEAAQEQLVAQANRFIGEQGGEIVQTIVQNADQPELARVAGIVSLVLLLWSASSIFLHLQDSLNNIWGVELRKNLPLIEKVKRRLFPLLVVIGIGILLVAAAIAGAALAAMSDLIGDLLPGGAILWQILNYAITLAVFTLLFGLIFKLMPDVKIAWRDVWPGAALTAMLFVVGQLLLGWYLGRQSSASVYGAAGSLIVLLLWIYYSAQIFLFGAEFTQVYATRYGHGVQPDKDAVPRGSQSDVKPAARAAGEGRAEWSSRGPGANGRVTGHVARAAQQAAAPPETLSSLSALATGLVGDLGDLGRLEMRLARTEFKEMVARGARGATFTAGGGLVLYAAALLVLACLALVLFVIMPGWLAALLVGVLLLAEGWVLMIVAQRKLALLNEGPKRIAESIGEDVETIKEHLTA